MRQIGGGRCDTCGRLGRQVGPEESPGGSGGPREVLWGALKTVILFFGREVVHGLMKY